MDLLRYQWWLYEAHGANQWYQAPYHWINVTEGLFWCVFCGLVLYRHFQCAPTPCPFKRRTLEIAYAFSFLCFALTDFKEAYALQNWLILVKGLNLGCLLWLRQHLIRRYYPDGKTY